MFKKYLAQIKELVAPLFRDIPKQQFMVTTISAAVMLGVLIVFWNFFILPHKIPAGNPQALSGGGVQVSSQDGRAKSSNPQGQGTGKDSLSNGEVGENAENSGAGEVSPKEQGTGNDPVSGKQGTENASLPEPDMSAAKLPLEGKLARRYGFTFSSTYKDYRFNGGIDVAAPAGTPVKCPLEGTVEQVATNEGSSGYTITINHGGGWKTVYDNILSPEVSKGSKAAAGAILGHLGTGVTVETATGQDAWLHLEVLHNGEKIDPLEYFDYQ